MKCRDTPLQISVHNHEVTTVIYQATCGQGELIRELAQLTSSQYHLLLRV